MSASLGRVNFLQKKHVPGLAMPLHRHDYPYLCWVVEGGFRESLGGESIQCGPGMVLLNFDARPHSDVVLANGARSFVVELAGGSPLPPVGARGIESPQMRHITARLEDERSAAADDASAMIVEGLLLQLIGQLKRERNVADSRHEPSWLRRVRQQLDDDFAARWTLVELAATAGVHPDHLGRSFSRFYGLQLGDYLRRRRLQWVATQLTGSCRGLAELAAAAGFADQSHLSKLFRAHFGLPPGRYRAKYGR